MAARTVPSRSVEGFFEESAARNLMKAGDFHAVSAPIRECFAATRFAECEPGAARNMCGIVGAIGPEAQHAERAVSALRHRGPDGAHSWRNDAGTACLGHTRLAILDLSTNADQPMHSSDGRVSLVFNGEIYNFRELRAELSSLGRVFRGTGDTEVVLQGFLEWGEQVVDRLRGMFAFAIWDARSQSLFVARDRLGIKPLFWTLDRGTLRFASELKGVLGQMAASPKTRLAAIPEFLTWLYVPPPGTFFEGVFELSPGHVLRWSPGQGDPVIARYWTVPSTISPMSFDDAARRLRVLLEETMRQHLLADVPVGAFLSGGLDSTTIVGLIARNTATPIRTFCMTFGDHEGLYDERQYAREVANAFGTEHREIPVRPQIAELLPKVIAQFDQPFGNPTSLLVYELSRLTREHVKVVLSGDGGDEVMLGYPRYSGVRLLTRYQKTPVLLRTLVARTADRTLNESTSGFHQLRRAREFLTSGTRTPAEAYASWVSYLGKSELYQLLTPSYQSVVRHEPWDEVLTRFGSGPADDPVAAAARSDLETFLPNNLLTYGDRMSMAHGLELRVPFCDHVLVEFCASLPSSVRMKGGTPKALLRAAVGDLLPPGVKRRAKLGFNPPMGLWLKGPLRDLAEARLDPKALGRSGIFDSTAVAKLRDEFGSGKRDHSLRLWSIIVVEEWLRLNPMN
jgi:asparagine synthase (glutamine-hydrolysing)